MKAALLVLVLGSIPAFAQDDSAAMAVQQAQQAMQQAVATAQQMQDQATITTLNMQQSMANTSSSSSSCGPLIGAAVQPNFSVKPGKVEPGTVVRIKSATHYATIYYTTDGWTPTTASTRYTGPITLSADAHFQAIALGPNLFHSSVARADYSVKSPTADPAQAAPVITDGVLRAGTTLRLVTSSEVSSKSAEVGDKISLALDQDVKVGDAVVAPKGTPVEAILTVADPAVKHRMPGDLVFRVHALNVLGKSIPLHGGQTLEGPASGRNQQEAVIEPSMVVLVTVAADTPLRP